MAFDLDRLDAQALDQTLVAAARLFIPQYGKPVAFEVGESNDDMENWQTAFFVAALFAFLGWGYWFARKKSRAKHTDWRDFATLRGWRYTEDVHKWYAETPFSIEGQIGELTFAMVWYKEGSGKSAQRKTQFSADIASVYTLNITPASSIFSAIFTRNRIKTGDPLYDCHFIQRQEGERLYLSHSPRNKHLALPWVLAWNATVGSQLDMLVVGTVTEKSVSSGKRGTRHYLSFRDIESQREINLNVAITTYESVRLGDPVVFKLTKGSLGIYRFTTTDP